MTLLFCIAFIPQNAHSQLRVGLTAAPAIQNLSVAEATITDGYKARLLPQGGVLLSLGLGKGFSARLGLRYEEKGFQYPTLPAFGQVDHSHWDKLRISFLGLALGAAYTRPITDRLSIGGAVDFVGGMPIAGKHKVEEDGKTIAQYNTVVVFVNQYLGLDLGLSLQYRMPSGIAFQLAPTFQTQINQVFGSNILLYRFVGFAPRLEVSFPLSKNK